MTANRITAGILSLILVALLGWCVFSGVGNAQTIILLGFGTTLGILYTMFGRLPDWIVEFSGGSITDDDAPSNIPPRIYLPILLGAILIAVAAFVGVIWAF